MPSQNSSHTDCQKQVKALQDLISVAQAVVSTLDLDAVLQTILTSAMEFADTPAGSIALYNARRRELSLHAHAGLTPEFVHKERWEVTPGGLTERVLAEGVIVSIGDVDNTDYFINPALKQEGIRSLVAVPLKFRNRLVGILYLDDFAPRCFEQSRIDLISVLASFAAMSIQNATLHNQTKLLAITDQLTGLHNHRYFKEYFEQEMVRAKRYQKPLSIIMLDIDNFKAFNDTYGHAVGDVLLSSLGEIIPTSIRSIDIAFRYGGEEFVVLLPDTGLASAIVAAERLREQVRILSAGAMQEHGTSGVTVSLGVASFPDNASSCNDLFQVVDQLLYRAKRQGKDAVHFLPQSKEQ
ncbi:GGDEF domain-containing protein [Geomesophilobacter sediminis]|uniref:diguanylate cyclase n=1 Tax=Geomesophilobacter sediminis TaxID=2798584 RepID=A0A8J7JKI6_9BACT|nr:sensor domain-containing diguanylate cyclase [Geomesophilobacter sediminis]MBJ6724950.1 sensor domain-containing diguanylate cyclase [Geomesophilobacter sediminis]